MRQTENVRGRFADLEQLRRGFEDLVHRARDELEQLGDFRESRTGVAVFDLADLERRVALEHAVEHLAELRCVTPERIGGLL
ncbi:hypothetical protein D3C73_869890 [compost metagenome]